MRHRGGWIITVTVAVLAATTVSAGATARKPSIVDRRVVFSVKNTNTSKVPCQSDGQPYHVVGHLVAPAALATDGHHAAVTVYLHGSGGGGYWHFQTVPGYDYVTQMAALGHASLSLDNLGYGESDIPQGNSVCTGSEADVIHQVIAELRSGSYDDGDRDGAAPAYERVASVGHSLGGVFGQAEAYSFHDIDAFATVEIANEGLPIAFFAQPAARVAAACAQGGQPKRAGAASGYAFTFSAADFHSGFLYNTDPSVIDARARAYERDACGLVSSLGALLAVDHALVPSIDVSALIAFGDPGLGWAPGTADTERAHYVSSPDARISITPDCGHELMDCRMAPTFRATMHQWLSARGF